MILLQDEGVLKAYMDIMVNPVYTAHLGHDEPPPNCQELIKSEEDELLPMGDDNKEITEQDMEKLTDQRMLAERHLMKYCFLKLFCLGSIYMLEVK
uniref:Bm9626 n=2 Tax=Brugia TaxID=6278 RepID=A0A0H5S6E2_BRUMA|nr:Bm9626 [Brugia malayi]